MAFTPGVDAAILEDLTARLQRTRLHDGAAKRLGTGNDRLRALVEHWLREFDWAAVEQAMSDLGSATTTTEDGRRLHYLHLPGQDADGERLPVLLLHGWPDTALQFAHLMPLLAAAGHPVVAPTAAGFGFSDEPSGELSPGLVADDVRQLMAELGYGRYLVHGTDWGATVGAALAENHPGSVAALHLLQPPFDRAFQVDRESASNAEKAYLAHMDDWSEKAAYVTAHNLQADTLAAGFSDSPVGLLAWLTDKYDAWSGDGIADADIIANTAVMWLTSTFRSSVRLYSEPADAWDDSAWADPAGDMAATDDEEGLMPGRQTAKQAPGQRTAGRAATTGVRTTRPPGDQPASRRRPPSRSSPTTSAPRHGNSPSASSPSDASRSCPAEVTGPPSRSRSSSPTICSPSPARSNEASPLTAEGGAGFAGVARLMLVHGYGDGERAARGTCRVGYRVSGSGVSQRVRAEPAMWGAGVDLHAAASGVRDPVAGGHGEDRYQVPGWGARVRPGESGAGGHLRQA